MKKFRLLSLPQRLRSISILIHLVHYRPIKKLNSVDLICFLYYSTKKPRVSTRYIAFFFAMMVEVLTVQYLVGTCQFLFSSLHNHTMQGALFCVNLHLNFLEIEVSIHSVLMAKDSNRNWYSSVGQSLISFVSSCLAINYTIHA
ncbi:hypothetical protein EDC96DRAFT_502666 [Choanephora cucurbitarum]|nr:hypothetical protein EDC96DRAFT_502666 [Choanephora cucurbitarum]